MKKIILGVLFFISCLFANEIKFDMNFTKDTSCEIRKIKLYQNPIWASKIEFKNGKNAFIKLIPINKTQGDEILSTTINTFAREAYLTCDNKMFSLILVPKEIPAQTIILKTVSDEKRVEKNKGQKRNEITKESKRNPRKYCN